MYDSAFNLRGWALSVKPSYERYHIDVKEVPSKITLPPRFLVKRFNNCTEAQECTQACIYGVHETKEDGKIAEPKSELCRGCYMCVLKCPKAAISIGINPEFEKLGNSYFTPERIRTIYFEAETGKVPVSGAGYTGPFAGDGFDGIWFDFSEIVRPTRDGIHGREYISTSVDLGRKLQSLKFDTNGNLVSKIPKTVEIPVPIIFDTPSSCGTSKNLQLAVARAAARLKTFAIVDAEQFSPDLAQLTTSIILRIRSNRIDKSKDLLKKSQIVEINDSGEDVRDQLKKMREINPSALVSFRFDYSADAPELANKLAEEGGDIVHFHIDDSVVEQDPDTIKNAIISVNTCLVNKKNRDKISLIFSGGIAEAAHVPKAIILGANAVALGTAYQIALGCTVRHEDARKLGCPVKLEDKDVPTATQRIVNLTGAWRDQLLEVLGGMGLREVRRQAGEMGRAMFHEDLETRVFGDGQ